MENLQSSTWGGPATGAPKKPLTPNQLDAFRPQLAGKAIPHAIQHQLKDEVYSLLGPGSGIPRPQAQRLAEIIASFADRIGALEEALRIKPALAGVETR